MIITDIPIDEIRQYYKHKFYSNTDTAHDIDHINTVERRMLDLYCKDDIDVFFETKYMIMFTAYLHDIYAVSNREFHHVEAADYVMNNSDIYLKMLNHQQRQDIAYAILSHRASSDISIGDYLSRALFTADKDLPILEDIVMRAANNMIVKQDMAFIVRRDYTSYVFNTHADALLYISNNLEATISIIQHIKDKYSRQGYLYSNRKMYTYLQHYKSELDILWEKIDNLTVETTQDIINR